MTRQRNGKQHHMLENGAENRVKSLKIRAPGVVWSSWATLLAPRWPKMRFGTRLGLYLEVCWGASWRQDGPSCGQDGAKLPNLAPRWAQDGNLRPQHGQLETILGSILPTFWDLGREKPDSKKPLKTVGFSRFLEVLGCSWRSCWLILARCWAMLGQLGAILEQLGDKMKPKSAKMSQDSARWRTRAPRRSKIGELSGPGGSQTGSTPWG